MRIAILLFENSNSGMKNLWVAYDDYAPVPNSPAHSVCGCDIFKMEEFRFMVASNIYCEARYAFICLLYNLRMPATIVALCMYAQASLLWAPSSIRFVAGGVWETDSRVLDSPAAYRIYSKHHSSWLCETSSGSKECGYSSHDTP